MKSSTIDMDFNFLKAMQKRQEDGHNELQQLERGQAKTSRRKREFAKRKTGFARAQERGVDVRKLAVWMERSRINKTTWHAKYF